MYIKSPELFFAWNNAVAYVILSNILLTHVSAVPFIIRTYPENFRVSKIASLYWFTLERKLYGKVRNV